LLLWFLCIVEGPWSGLPYAFARKKIRKAIGAHLPKAAHFNVLVNWKRPAQRTPKMTPEEFAALPESLDVRVVRYRIGHKGFRT
jgi:hypothetical protein